MVKKNRIIDFNTDAIANENNSHPFIKPTASFINPVFVYNQPEKETKYLVDPLDLGFDIGNTNTNDFNYLLGFPPGGLNTKDNFVDILGSDGIKNTGSDLGLLDLYTNPFNPLGSGGTKPDWNSGLVVSVGETTMQITGVVYNTYGETLPGASVSWINHLTRLAEVTTDFNGRFNAEVPTDAKITISYMGFKSITFKANNVPSKIVLQEDVEALDGFPPEGLNTKDNFVDILGSDGIKNTGSDLGLLDLYTNPFNPLGSGGTKPDWNSGIVVSVGATTMQITGVVYNTYGETLPRASVSWINPLRKQAGVTTDSNGLFNAEVPTDAEITISYVGLKPITFKANNVPSKIVLQENGQLDEIVIYAKNNKKPLMYVGIGLAVVIAGGLLMRKSKQSTKKGKGLKGATPVTL